MYGVELTEAFWREVQLRAENNYGPFDNEKDAQTNVENAMSEVLSDIYDTYLSNTKVSEIVKDMLSE